jgi:hypothetical protein
MIWDDVVVKYDILPNFLDGLKFKVLWKRKVYLCVVVVKLTRNRFGRILIRQWYKFLATIYYKPVF